MKKTMVIFAVIISMALMFQVTVPRVSHAATDTATATILSVVAPGAGEWYNEGYKRSYPWAECIIGYICVCFRISSAIDASNGDSTDRIRIDFWSTPTK